MMGVALSIDIAPSLNNATALVAGSSHTCALKEDKSITCWGKQNLVIVIEVIS